MMNRHTEPRFLNVAIICLTALMFFHEICGIHINQYAFVVLATIYIPFANFQNALYYTSFLMPLVSGMNLVAMWVPYVCLIMKSTKLAKIQYIPTICLIALEIIDNWLFYPHYEFKNIFLYTPYLGMLFFLPFINTNKVDLKKVIRYFVYAMALTCGLLVLRLIFNGELNRFLDSGHRIGYGIVNADASEPTINLNPNCLGYYAIVAYVIILSIGKRIGIKPVVCMLLICVLTYVGALSISRTWLLLFILFNAIFICFYFSKLQVLLFAPIVIIGFLQYGELLNSISANYEQRFNEDSTTSAGGRTDIIDFYNDYMIDNVDKSLSGIGVLYSSYITNSPHSIHNGLQQILIGYGIIGLFTFSVFFISFYNRYVASRRLPTKVFMPLVCAVLFLMTIQFLYPYIQISPLIFTLLILRMNPKDSI